MTQTIRIPVYTYGRYRAQDGTVEEFTDETMREYVKNTNFVIQSKAFIPAVGYVGYDHPVFGRVKDTDAHGHIKAAVYENGVVKLDVLPIPDREGRLRLVEDRKAGRRPAVSGEHSNNFSFVDATGKTVHVGRTILGLAALGSERPAVKNPLMVQCSELQFPETIPAADAFMAREELRKSGMVAQTFSEGVLVFSEIQLPAIEEEPPKEQPMTTEELAAIQKMITDSATAIQANVATQIKAVEDKTATTIKAMSETEAAKQKTLGKVKLIVDEKKLSKISAAKLEAAALDPTTENVLAFGETLSAIVLPGGTAKRGKDGDKGDDGDEPEALSKVRPIHFSDPNEHGDLLDAGIVAFGEYKPDAFKGVEDNPAAQLDRLRNYVTARDVSN